MGFYGLSRFVKLLEAEGELVRVKSYVNPILEIAEVTDRVSKSPGGGKALLFENTGTAFPLLINTYGSNRRMSLILGIKELDEARGKIELLIKTILKPPGNLKSKLGLLPKLAKVALLLPKVQRGKGACQEIILRTPDLFRFPVLKCWPGDGGRFVTLPMVITKNPLSGRRNVGMYRMQVIDKNTTAMHWHPHKTGANHFKEYMKRKLKMPVAIALGGDPLLAYSATAPLPENIDEFAFAGFLRKKRVKLVKCITQDMEVPAEADIVMEGFIDPEEDFFLEGPFGDHTGFYSLPDFFPKLHITCITHRKDAIYPATIVGIPPMEDAWIARATEKLFVEPIRFGLLPEVQDMHFPAEGVVHNLAIISMDKQYPGHPQKVMNALWGAGQMMFNKVMIVVDKDEHLTNYTKLAQKILRNFNPLTDIYMGQGPFDILDHASDSSGFGSKIGIDGTDKEEGKTYAKQNKINRIKAEDLEMMYRKYPYVEKINVELYERNVPVLIGEVKGGAGIDVKALAKELLTNSFLEETKIILFVDHGQDINNTSLVVWYLLNNIDPIRDIFIQSFNNNKVCLVVNGMNKYYITEKQGRKWPNVILSDETTRQAIDAKWDSLMLGGSSKSPSLLLQGVNKHEGALYNPMV